MSAEKWDIAWVLENTRLNAIMIRKDTWYSFSLNWFCQNLFSGLTYFLSWRMFCVCLRRMCILLLMDGLFCVCLPDNPMDCSTPGFPVLHQLPELTQTHVHRVSDTIQPSHPLSSPSPPAFNLSQHQGLFKWVSSSHQVAKVLEFQLQHQSFQ